MTTISYQQLFYLFMFGNMLGVFLEGIWCKFRYGKWETHVVALWGPFNIVYGIGIVMFYIGEGLLIGRTLGCHVVMLALTGSLVEYLCGVIIRVGIGMKAWDYRKHFLNIQGLISLKMAFMWGALGFCFDRFFYKPLMKLLSSMTGTLWKSACVGLSIFMGINVSCTAACIIRWANRHKGKTALNRISRFIDRKYTDNWMKKKFCNWSFIESESLTESRSQEQGERYKV